MKFPEPPEKGEPGKSAPTRGPWIEIPAAETCRKGTPGSAPTRGPWIEMENEPEYAERGWVGPHTGAVD